MAKGLRKRGRARRPAKTLREAPGRVAPLPHGVGWRLEQLRPDVETDWDAGPGRQVRDFERSPS
jgi:hypothetical protein